MGVCCIYNIPYMCVCTRCDPSRMHPSRRSMSIGSTYVGTRTILLCGFLAVPVPPNLTRVPTTVPKVPICHCALHVS